MAFTVNLSPEELEKLTPDQIRYLSRKESLLRTALEDALILDACLRAKLLAENSKDREGIWWDSLAPLTPHERTLVLCEACGFFEIPVPRWLRKALEDHDRKAREWGQA